MTDRAQELLDRAHTLALTYPRSSGGSPPRGYRAFRRSLRVSADAADFDRAVEMLRTWEVHRGAGLTVVADGPARAGSHVVVGIGPRPFTLLAPCRVVEDVDDPTRNGFAYGTLPGHPERGEERFVVEKRPGEGVFFEITAFSRPATAPARLGGPLTRLVQDRVTTRYLHALRAAVSGS
ncbi:DUF1990 domain-containing protein [Cryptosporangium japonicum]|uniref:DUF1990 domain-containing protein n=1 Tax=Cryptosporangium japonicum TaxID=80872 RepID=A0ABP3DT02_9ACTN